MGTSSRGVTGPPSIGMRRSLAGESNPAEEHCTPVGGQVALPRRGCRARGASHGHRESSDGRAPADPVSRLLTNTTTRPSRLTVGTTLKQDPSVSRRGPEPSSFIIHRLGKSVVASEDELAVVQPGQTGICRRFRPAGREVLWRPQDARPVRSRSNRASSCMVAIVPDAREKDRAEYTLTSFVIRSTLPSDARINRSCIGELQPPVASCDRRSSVHVRLPSKRDSGRRQCADRAAVGLDDLNIRLELTVEHLWHEHGELRAGGRPRGCDIRP